MHYLPLYLQGKTSLEASPAQLAASSEAVQAEPTESTAPAAACSKARRKGSKKTKTCQRQLRQFVTSVTVDGETFKVGDSAYLRMTDDFDEDEFTEVEVCQICGAAEPEDVARVECDKCLMGYHISCLKPPLTAVPKVMLSTCCNALHMIYSQSSCQQRSLRLCRGTALCSQGIHCMTKQTGSDLAKSTTCPYCDHEGVCRKSSCWLAGRPPSCIPSKLATLTIVLQPAGCKVV